VDARCQVSIGSLMAGAWHGLIGSEKRGEARSMQGFRALDREVDAAGRAP